ncbi:GNAT family N-acetyltransferase [Micromonospora sp. HSS6-12]|uniref:GNAT family N-acetyltransferase n=1 Tax=Micromonospora thermarum TaxID=2720024 RepID=A0ABX0ZGT1_9ACTN|nr:GNAT family N-acetyltransferase [Micromonospora thermarum]
MTEIRPDADEALARSVLAVQHAAYAVEAALIGDDRIPPLHETVADLRAAPLRWLAADLPGPGVIPGAEPRLAGAIAWTEDDTTVDIDRLVVDPAAHRRGVGRALVTAVLTHAGARRVLVATGRANQPARRLYESLGFTAIGDEEVIPGLWISRYARCA